MTEVSHFVREAGWGLLRNWRAALAAAVLLMLATMLLSSVVWLRAGFGDVYGYLQSQLTMKLYIAEGYDAAEVASAVAGISSAVTQLEVATGPQQLADMRQLFQDKPRLLAAFAEDGAIPDAIDLTLEPGADVTALAAAFGEMRAIGKVIYPQAFAEQVGKWAVFAGRYGMLILVLVVFAAFVTVFLAVRMALLTRRKEIRLKLLLGANPRLVSLQFVLEGLGMGLLGGFPAAALSAWGYSALVAGLREQWPAIFLNLADAGIGTAILMALAGPLLGMLAAWTAVRKLD